MFAVVTGNMKSCCQCARTVLCSDDLSRHYAVISQLCCGLSPASTCQQNLVKYVMGKLSKLWVWGNNFGNLVYSLEVNTFFLKKKNIFQSVLVSGI